LKTQNATFYSGYINNVIGP